MCGVCVLVCVGVCVCVVPRQCVVTWRAGRDRDRERREKRAKAKAAEDATHVSSDDRKARVDGVGSVQCACVAHSGGTRRSGKRRELRP